MVRKDSELSYPAGLDYVGDPQTTERLLSDDLMGFDMSCTN